MFSMDVIRDNASSMKDVLLGSLSENYANLSLEGVSSLPPSLAKLLDPYAVVNQQLVEQATFEIRVWGKLLPVLTRSGEFGCLHEPANRLAKLGGLSLGLQFQRAVGMEAVIPVSAFCIVRDRLFWLSPGGVRDYPSRRRTVG